MSELNSSLRHAGGGWRHNAVTVYLLGLSPLLALSNTLITAITLLCCLALLLAMGSTMVTLFERQLPQHNNAIWRLPLLIVTLAIVTSIFNAVIANIFPALHVQLGNYLLLLCCNFAVLVHLEKQRSAAPANDQLRAGLLLLGGYALALLPLAVLRELLTFGALFQDIVVLSPGSDAVSSKLITKRMGFASTPAAAFLLLGLLIALANFLMLRIGSSSAPKPGELTPAARARVTEKLQ